MNLKIVARFLYIFTGLFSLYLTLISGGVSSTLIMLIAVVIIFAEFLFGFTRSETTLPYLLLIISPITLISYSTLPDFRIRIITVMFLAYIVTIPFCKKNRLKNLLIPENNPFLIWIIPFILFIALSIWLDYKGVNLSGDEPHYLMVTQSMVEDGDILLKNNVENKTYMDFIPVELPAHMIIHNGKHLSFHMPGLSLLLIPFYLLFKITGGLISPHLFFRISISVINAFFPFVLFYLAKFIFPEKKIIRIWILSILTVPVLFHSVHIFPELPASTLLIGSFLLMHRDRTNPLLGGFLYSLTIWFHVKYYPLLLLFGLFIIWNLFKKRDDKALIKFLVFPVISSIILVLFSKITYGTFNPTGIFPSENYLTTPLLLKIKVFFSYFLDQRDGLLLYAPTLFLFIVGLKKMKHSLKLPAALLAIYTVFHSITTVRGAYSPAGRPLIFVLWILLLFAYNHYFNSDRKYLFILLSGINFFILFWILNYPQFIYQPVFASTSSGASSVLQFMSSNRINLSSLFPSFLTVRTFLYLPNVVWIILLFVIFLTYDSKGKNKIYNSEKLKKSISVIIFVISTLSLSLFPHIKVSGKDNFRQNGISMFNTSANFIWIENDKRFRVKSNEEYSLYFEERKWKKKICFEFTTPPESSLTVMNGKKKIFSSNGQGTHRLKIDLSKMDKVTTKNKKLIPIWIKTGHCQNSSFFYLKITGK